MSLHGSASNAWVSQFPDDYVPIIISMILDAWETFVTDEVLEPKISRQFFCQLLQHQEANRLPFLIDYEVSYPNEDGSKDVGRLDYRFIHGYRRNVYFSIECKRLRVTFPGGKFDALANEYVEEGMCRYFNGQYATDLNKGGMLGLAMDGNAKAALADVKKAIEARRSALYMDPKSSLQASSLIKNSLVKETHHTRKNKDPFGIHHVVLPVKRRLSFGS